MDTWVITDAGCVTAAGDDTEALFSALVEGRPLIVAAGANGFPSVPHADFDPKRHLDRKGLRDLSRTSQMACAAAAHNARGLAGIAADRVGVVFGSAWGSLETVVRFEREAYVEGPRFVDPIRFTETVANVAAGQVAIFFGWSAFNATVSAGSASGLVAVLRAIEFLEEGRGEVAVAGGGDELNPAVLGALRAQGMTAPAEGSLPLGAGRAGPIGGEGACLLTIERADRAAARGARARARIEASAVRFDAAKQRGGGFSTPLLEEMLRDLLDGRGGAGGADVDCLVLSADGSREGDASLAQAVVSVFGRGASAPPCVLPKAVLGETWGASGPIGIVAAMEAIRTDTVPARPRGLSVAPEAEGVHLPAETLRRPVRAAAVIDCAATGHLTAVVISGPEEAA